MLRPGILIVIGLTALNPFQALSVNLPSLSIQFREQATVESATIRLGDLARIMAGEAKVVAELETLTVANSASFGLTRVVESDFIVSRFLKAYTFRYNIDFNSKSIRVTTRGYNYPIDSLTRLIDAFVAEQPKLPGEIRNWEMARCPSNIVVPAGKYALALSYLGAKRKGKVDLNLAIRNEAKILRNLTITINLRIEQPVLVALKQIERDMVLGPENVKVETRETTLMNDMAVLKPEQLMGQLAKVTIIPGRVITPRLVALAPAVKRGQGAKIVFQNGMVSVTADAVCRQDGVVGQIISAKNLATNRLVRVRVTEGGGLVPIPGG